MARGRPPNPTEAEEIQKEFWKGVASKLGAKYIASYKDETVTIADPKTGRQQQTHRWFLELTGVIK